MKQKRFSKLVTDTASRIPGSTDVRRDFITLMKIIIKLNIMSKSMGLSVIDTYRDEADLCEIARYTMADAADTATLYTDTNDV